MRKINTIVVHCSATKEGKHFSVKEIEKWHKERGFSEIGYHYIIYIDGSIMTGRDINKSGAHVAGNNSNTIGVCYVGGLSLKGDAKDTRTAEQKASLVFLLEQLKEKYPNAKICGHRDYSPDLNGNGIIEPFEFIKQCPCFDAKKEYKNL